MEQEKIIENKDKEKLDLLKKLDNFEKSIQSNETKRSMPIKSKSKEINISKTEMIQIDERDENDENLNLIKVSFIHFILNNIYCKKSKRRKEQETIEICNKIIAKYISLDVIIYNQIALEHLFKDYKWNDVNLKKIENNIFLKKLNLIK